MIRNDANLEKGLVFYPDLEYIGQIFLTADNIITRGVRDLSGFDNHGDIIGNVEAGPPTTLVIAQTIWDTKVRLPYSLKMYDKSTISWRHEIRLDRMSMNDGSSSVSADDLRRIWDTNIDSMKHLYEDGWPDTSLSLLSKKNCYRPGFTFEFVLGLDPRSSSKEILSIKDVFAIELRNSTIILRNITSNASYAIAKVYSPTSSSDSPSQNIFWCFIAVSCARVNDSLYDMYVSSQSYKETTSVKCHMNVTNSESLMDNSWTVHGTIYLSECKVFNEARPPIVSWGQRRYRHEAADKLPLTNIRPTQYDTWMNSGMSIVPVHNKLWNFEVRDPSRSSKQTYNANLQSGPNEIERFYKQGYPTTRSSANIVRLASPLIMLNPITNTNDNYKSPQFIRTHDTKVPIVRNPPSNKRENVYVTTSQHTPPPGIEPPPIDDDVTVVSTFDNVVQNEIQSIIYSDMESNAADMASNITGVSECAENVARNIERERAQTAYKMGVPFSIPVAPSPAASPRYLSVKKNLARDVAMVDDTKVPPSGVPTPLGDMKYKYLPTGKVVAPIASPVRSVGVASSADRGIDVPKHNEFETHVNDKHPQCGALIDTHRATSLTTDTSGNRGKAPPSHSVPPLHISSRENDIFGPKSGNSDRNRRSARRNSPTRRDVRADTPRRMLGQNKNGRGREGVHFITKDPNSSHGSKPAYDASTLKVLQYRILKVYLKSGIIEVLGVLLRPEIVTSVEDELSQQVILETPRPTALVTSYMGAAPIKIRGMYIPYPVYIDICVMGLALEIENLCKQQNIVPLREASKNLSQIVIDTFMNMPQIADNKQFKSPKVELEKWTVDSQWSHCCVRRLSRIGSIDDYGAATDFVDDFKTLSSFWLLIAQYSAREFDQTVLVYSKLVIHIHWIIMKYLGAIEKVQADSFTHESLKSITTTTLVVDMCERIISCVKEGMTTPIFALRRVAYVMIRTIFSLNNTHLNENYQSELKWVLKRTEYPVEGRWGVMVLSSRELEALRLIAK